MGPRDTIQLRTGAEMPLVGLGTWQLKDDTSGTVAAALRLGYRMIDTSSDYGTQPGIGDGMIRSGVSREDIYLVTKVEETDDAYARVKQNLEELQTDYADLMLIHRPPRSGAGEQLWRGLMRARDEGLTRDIGVSNYPADTIDALIAAEGEAPAVNQVEWSPFGHSARLKEHARRHGIVIQAYSPLTRATRLDNAMLREIAGLYGKAPAQVLIRWNIQTGTVPLPKANQRMHLEENLAIFDFELKESDIELLNSLNERYSALGNLPYE